MQYPLTLPRAMGLLLISAMAWGGMFPLAKVLLVHIDAFSMTSIRYGLAALLFLAVLRWREGRAALRLEGQGWRVWLYGSLGFAGFNLLAFEGLGHTQPEHAAIIMALMPLLTALVNWLLTRVRPSGTTLAAIALALLGVGLVITDGHWTRLLEGADIAGDGLLLAGALCWVVYTLGAQKFPGWSPLRYTALSCALGALSILGITAAAILAGHAHLPTAAGLGASAWGIVYLVLIAAFVAVLGWNAGIRRVGAQGVLFINLVPVTAFIIGVLQGHHFGSAEVVGAALVMLALVLNSVLARQDVRDWLLRAQRVVNYTP
ncbi:MAG TPA: DMT family transporter [Sulfuriferula sp.]|nr:DMT family transporter [Sulfuriferula sp.]